MNETSWLVLGGVATSVCSWWVAYLVGYWQGGQHVLKRLRAGDADYIRGYRDGGNFAKDELRSQL